MLIKDGEVEKISRKLVQTRYLILLSDCLLYTSYIGLGTSLKVGYTIPLGDLQVRAVPPSPDRPSPTEFEITSSVTTFTIRATCSLFSFFEVYIFSQVSRGAG